MSAFANFKLGGVLAVLHLYCATFEQELLFFVVLRYIVLLILLVKKRFPVTDPCNKDLRHRPPVTRFVARRALQTLKKNH